MDVTVPAKAEHSGVHDDDIVSKVQLAINSADYKKLYSLSEKETRAALDLLWNHLERLRKEVRSPQRNRLRRILVSMSDTSGMFPGALLLKGVRLLEADARASGPLTDIHIGTFSEKQVALKGLRVVLLTSGSVEPELKQEYYREALRWKTLSHQYLLPLLGVTVEVFQRRPCLVLPWMENGHIIKYVRTLQKRGKLSGTAFSERVNKWIQQIALGLAYLHSEEVMHGDLRCNNVLIDDDGNVQLTDFGMTKLPDIIQQSYASMPGEVIRWQSPELLDPEEFGIMSTQPTCASDVYSFACTCIELYTSKPPFYGEGDEYRIVKKVLKGGRPSRPTGPESIHIPDDLWALVTECWAQQPSGRPTADEVAASMSTMLEVKSAYPEEPKAPPVPPKDRVPPAHHAKRLTKTPPSSSSLSQPQPSTSPLEGLYFWRWFQKAHKG